MFKINKINRTVRHEYTHTKIVTPAVVKTTVRPAIVKEVIVYELEGYTISITAKAVNIGGSRITKEILEALLSGEMDDVKGIKAEYDIKYFLNEDLTFDGFVFPKGARYSPADWHGNHTFKTASNRVIKVASIPKSANIKSVLREEKIPWRHTLRGYVIERTKTRVKIGCKKASYNSIKGILKVMESKAK